MIYVSQFTEKERSSGWQPWYLLEALKLAFNVSREYQGCHAHYLSVSVLRNFSGLFHRCRSDWPGAIEVTLNHMG